jgi:hypothetical protein
MVAVGRLAQHSDSSNAIKNNEFENIICNIMLSSSGGMIYGAGLSWRPRSFKIMARINALFLIVSLVIVAKIIIRNIRLCNAIFEYLSPSTGA